MNLGFKTCPTGLKAPEGVLEEGEEMTGSIPPVAWLAAFLDGGISQVLIQAIKVLAVAAGVVVGWFAGAPLTRVLVRLAFHRETPKTVQTIGRFGGAFLVGFLAYLIPIALGGS